MTIGIYSIQNTINSKEYIGSSQNIELRWRIHRNDLRSNKHHSKHLQRSWNLDGESAFIFKILVECPVGDLLVNEQFFINERNSAHGDFGYNVSAVAGSRRGVKHSDEVRAKMRESASKRPAFSKEYKKAQSEIMKKAHAGGKLFSKEHRCKISKGLIGRVVSKETREKIGAASLGRAVSDSTKAKLSAANKGKPLSENNYKNLLLRSKTVNIITPEIRAKMTASRAETYRAERERIALTIVPLRESGMSYEKICKKLNDSCEPTISRSLNGTKSTGTWFPMIVRTIYLEFTKLEK
jgi:group I intron endonuclease